MPSVAAPRGGAGRGGKRAPLRDRNNEERFDEEDSEGEVAWRSPNGGRTRDMRQLRPYYFLVRKSFVVRVVQWSKRGCKVVNSWLYGISTDWWVRIIKEGW